MNKINCMIKDFMDERNLSAKEFASLIQGSEDTVKNWLYKNVTPSKEFVKTISDVLAEDYLNMRQLWLDAMLPKEQIFTDERFLLPDDKYREDVLTDLERNIENKFTSNEKLVFGYCWILAKIFFANEANLFTIDEILNDTDKNGRILVRKLRDSYDFPIGNEIFNFFMNDYYTGISRVRGATTTYNNCSNLRNAVKLTLFNAKTKFLSSEIEFTRQIKAIKQKYSEYILSEETKNVSEEELKSIIYSLLTKLTNKFRNGIRTMTGLLLVDSEEFKKYYIIVRAKDCYKLYHRLGSLGPDTSDYKRSHHIEEDNIIEFLKKKLNQIKEEKPELVNVELVPEGDNEMLNDIGFLQTLSQEEINVLKKLKERQVLVLDSNKDIDCEALEPIFL